MTLGALQTWAINGLSQLVADDPDKAREINGVGFSKLDGDFGESLFNNYQKYGKLSPKQWACALKLAFKYRRQVGEPPMDFVFPNF